eukprot:gene35290-16892_t
MPSSHRPHSAFLDLSRAMRTPRGDAVPYVQVVAARASEAEAYRAREGGTYAVLSLPAPPSKELPRLTLVRLRAGATEAAVAAAADGRNFLTRAALERFVDPRDHGELYPAASVAACSGTTVTVAEYRGVGEARFCLKRLADRVCPADDRFAFMLDDNVKFWWGVTLPGDTSPLFGVPARDVAQRHDLPLAELLRHWQGWDGVKDFAGIGFPRWRPSQMDVRAPFQPAFLYSAYILNLSRLCGVDYNPAVSKWEDIDFQRRAEARGGVFVRANRCAQGRARRAWCFKVRLKGGCTAH